MLFRSVFDAIADVKRVAYGREFPSLDVDESLIALGISSNANPTARLALESLPRLSGCEVHLTHIASPNDQKALRRLGMNLTSAPSFESDKLFVA